MVLGSGIAGGIAWFSGADSKGIAYDMFLGGLIGGASGGIGGLVTDGIRVGAAGLLSRLSPFVQKFLPVAIGGGAAGFSESALWDKSKNGKVNWKNAAVSAGICFTLVFGVAKVGPKIINGINNIPIPPVFQTAVQTAGGDVVTIGPQTVGDTSFGQWLQKFASKKKNGGSTSFNWGNPKSRPTYGHTFLEHGKNKKPNQLIDRARQFGHQIGQWLSEKEAADFIAEVAQQKGPGVHDVPLPSSIKTRGFLPDGTEIKGDMATIVVKEDGSVKTAYPYNNDYPKTKKR